MNRLRLFYRINRTGEKGLFEEFRKMYDGVAINANFAAYYSDWIPAFLTGLNKPYFIDPVTYVFARNLDVISKEEEELKKSYKKLRKVYGEDLEKITESRELLPKDFEDSELHKKLAKSVIAFQKNLVVDQSQKSLAEYLEILGRKKEMAKPEFLVAPYFYFSSIDDPWYEISLRTAKASIKNKKDDKLFGVFCASKSTLLDETILERFRKDYRDFDGYMVLIPNFKEKEEEENSLRGLIKLINKLSESKKPVYLLFGGYFSLILSRYGLKGYIRSICYGESKDIDSGVTIARQPRNYYFSLTHSKIQETTARTFYSENPELLCRCNICSKIMPKTKSKKDVEKFFNSIDFNKEARAHFMTVHHSEIQKNIGLLLWEIAGGLKKDLETCQKLDAALYNIPCDYLGRWISVLQ